MGERKGQNFYYPPDFDPKKTSSLNAYHGTHALRERARKIHLGIIIIRFEMPYNIWCDGCENHIGMGVRYNAEKTKVGMYYTTPVFEFKMKCHLCVNYIVMKTDPANLDYVIISGARRQENRWDPIENEQIVPEDKNVSRQLNSDAMFKLEHGKEEKIKVDNVAPSLEKLEILKYKYYKDDYVSNKKLRDSFRSKKKEIKSIEEADNELLKKCSLNINLVKESEDDKKLASLLRLQPLQSPEEVQKEKRLAIEKKSQFPLQIQFSSSSCSLPTSISTVSSFKEESRSRREMARSLLGIKPKK